ncbi:MULTISPECIES: alpha/beta hydrolase [unclassified Variovorax]|uniref:alpha/beta hydrolase n=1 Tax=unclassified Variovorax TaxID=663243 RepID=UPI000D127D56|nr:MULTISPECIES: alpha/beta fold hydrolase [unclassified Variovorax]AVQ83287.1 alpha/beta hydrolase [Variovorax sp. PMC12]QRY32405.1 alpha/beta fold hydrolase [Variovorax sp. PDNC026]
MNSQTEKITLQGAAGRIEVQRDQPAETPRGVAVIAHPHPLFSGTMDNKVVQTLARAFVAGGWTAVRFNFRGVGASEGVHDEGRGELEDMLDVVRQLAPEGPLAIAGFSFGAFVASGAVSRLWAARDVRQIVLVGTAAARNVVAPLPVEAHERALVIHGEADDTVALSAVMDWARPQSLPVTVIPGGGHFFHGQLPLLKSLVARHLRAGAA